MAIASSLFVCPVEKRFAREYVQSYYRERVPVKEGKTMCQNFYFVPIAETQA
jgi:hypothetical protein